MYVLAFIHINITLVPSEPHSLTLVSADSSSVTLQWSPPETPNGVIMQYFIQLNGTNIVNLRSNVLMYTIKGLSPDTVYVLQLRAHTRAGAGPSSSMTVMTRKLHISYASYTVTFGLLNIIF